MAERDLGMVCYNPLRLSGRICAMPHQIAGACSRDGAVSRLPSSTLLSPTERSDILVHAEEIVGVVTALDVNQAAVVCAIRFLTPFVFIVGHEVDVHAAGGETRGRIEQSARPCDASRVLSP